MSNNKELLKIGFGNAVLINRVIGLFNPDSAPVKRLIAAARDDGRLIDATQGRKTRSVIVTDADKIILSALQTETLEARIGAGKETDEREEN